MDVFNLNYFPSFKWRKKKEEILWKINLKKNNNLCWRFLLEIILKLYAYLTNKEHKDKWKKKTIWILLNTCFLFQFLKSEFHWINFGPKTEAICVRDKWFFDDIFSGECFLLSIFVISSVLNMIENILCTIWLFNFSFVLKFVKQFNNNTLRSKLHFPNFFLGTLQFVLANGIIG